jgi:DNA-binding CsgD family transcriptional regulator
LTKARQTQDPQKSAHPALVEALKAMKTLPVSAAIIDLSGTIVAVNDTWREFAEANGLSIPDAGVGVNYLQYCVDDQLARELEALLSGRRDLLTRVYPCHSLTKRRWFSLIGIPLSLEKPGGVALLHVNLTEMLTPQFHGRLAQVENLNRDQLPAQADVASIGGAVEQSVSEALSSQLNKMFRGSSDKRVGQETEQRIRLSERQIEVLRLLGEGKTNREIAQALFRSPNTIKLHVSAILKELRLKSRTQAALLASQLQGSNAIRLPVRNNSKKKRTAQRGTRH